MVINENVKIMQLGDNMSLITSLSKELIIRKCVTKTERTCIWRKDHHFCNSCWSLLLWFQVSCMAITNIENGAWVWFFGCNSRSCRELLWKQDNPVAQKVEHSPRSNKVLGLNARTDIPSTPYKYSSYSVTSYKPRIISKVLSTNSTWCSPMFQLSLP